MRPVLLVLVFVVLFTFGFGAEDEFGVSSYGGVDFSGGIGKPAADGALDAFDGGHHVVTGHLRVHSPFQEVFVSAENIAAALLEEAGSVGVMVVSSILALREN